MRTVKEVSGITGISVRTLHYYDQIGLLKPSAASGAGYRLYDDKALERLQQMAEEYVRNEKLRGQLDDVYGEGFALFIEKALEAFYASKKA